MNCNVFDTLRYSITVCGEVFVKNAVFLLIGFLKGVSKASYMRFVLYHNDTTALN